MLAIMESLLLSTEKDLAGRSGFEKRSPALVE
jgi:hypothetical protein